MGLTPPPLYRHVRNYWVIFTTPFLKAFTRNNPCAFFLPCVSWKRFPQIPVYWGIGRYCSLKECTLKELFSWNPLYVSAICLALLLYVLNVQQPINWLKNLVITIYILFNIKNKVHVFSPQALVNLLKGQCRYGDQGVHR